MIMNIKCKFIICELCYCFYFYFLFLLPNNLGGVNVQRCNNFTLRLFKYLQYSSMKLLGMRVVCFMENPNYNLVVLYGC